MKKKLRYSNSLNISVGLTTAICLINLSFVIIFLIIDSKYELAFSNSVYIILTINTAIIIFVLIMFFIYCRRLRTKVIQPVELLKEELDKLTSGDIATPIENNDVEGMEDIYKALESIRRDLDTFNTLQKEKREERKTYVSGLMHDIATPVTRINGCASMICDGMVTTQEDIYKFAEMIMQNTEDINIMLKNLAEIEKYDRTDIHSNLIPIDVSYVIGYYLNGLQLELAARGVTINFVNKCKNATVCRLDVKSCKRVLMNLINNSIKYKKFDVPCEILMTIEDGEPGQLLFSLADNGTGIEYGTEEKIFELFYRGDKSRHNPDIGNGIGLYVSYQIMKANNSEMWAENNGNGLTVYVSIPLVDEKPVDWFEVEK